MEPACRHLTLISRTCLLAEMLLVSNIPFTTSAVFVAFWQAFQFRERKNFTKSDKKSDKTNKSDRTNKMKSMAA